MPSMPSSINIPLDMSIYNHIGIFFLIRSGSSPPCILTADQNHYVQDVETPESCGLPHVPVSRLPPPDCSLWSSTTATR